MSFLIVLLNLIQLEKSVLKELSRQIGIALNHNQWIDRAYLLKINDAELVKFLTFLRGLRNSSATYTKCIPILFSLEKNYVETSRLRTSTCWSPKVVGSI